MNKSGLKFTGQFSYISIQDGNSGNDLIARIGKKFYEDVYFGYEYMFANYARTSFFYYSPQNFDAHSLWMEWETARPSLLVVHCRRIGQALQMLRMLLVPELRAGCFRTL